MIFALSNSRTGLMTFHNPDQIPKTVVDLMNRFHQRRKILIGNLALALLIPVFLLVNAWLLHDALGAVLPWYEALLFIGLICSGLHGFVFVPNLLFDIRELKSLDQSLRAEGYRPLWLVMPPIQLSNAVKGRVGAGITAVALCLIGTLIQGEIGLLFKLAGLVGFITTGALIGLQRT